MPQSSGSAHTHGESSQLGDGQGPAPRPYASTEATEPVHAAHSARNDRVRFDSSRPLSDPAVPPLCDFESFFATSDPQSVGRQRLRWYPRV